MAFNFLPPRRLPDLGDLFYEETLDYFHDQIGEMSREIGVEGAYLPIITGWLTANTFVDLDVDSRLLGGDDLVTVQFLSNAEYAPEVASLPGAIDRYLERVAYPRWTRDIEGGF